MQSEEELSVRTAASLQEAIDTVVQTFDYPGQLSIQYESIDGRKVTTIEIEREGEIETFELRFRPDEPNGNPVLRRVPEDQ